MDGLLARLVGIIQQCYRSVTFNRLVQSLGSMLPVFLLVPRLACCFRLLACLLVACLLALVACLQFPKSE